MVGLRGVDADPFFDGARAAVGVFAGQGIEPSELDGAVFVSRALTDDDSIMIAGEEMEVNVVVVGEAESRAGCAGGRLEVVYLLPFEEIGHVPIVVKFGLIGLR